MKKFLLLTLILIVAFTFCGCTTIAIERRINKDSSIEDIVTVKFDKDLAKSYGYSEEYVIEVICDYMEANGYEVTDSGNAKVIGKKYYATHAEFSETVPKGEDEPPAVDGFFTDVYETRSKPPFYTMLVNDIDVRIMNEHFERVDSELVEEVDYVYMYTTPYENVETNGEKIENGSYITHKWVWDKESVEIDEVVISQTVPDKTGWYLVAIGAGIIVVATGFIVVGIMKGKKGEEDDG